MNSPIAGVPQRHSELLKSLAEFGKQHRAARWAGTFSSFLEGVFPTDPHGIARSSHQYIWDMMRVEGLDDSAGRLRCPRPAPRSAGGSFCCSGHPPAANPRS